MHPLLVLLLAAAPLAAAAPGADPLKSPACGQAVDALVQARSAAEQDARLSSRVEPLRQRAARVCLGVTENTQPSGRLAQPPQRVPPPAIEPPRPPVTAAAPPPPAIERPPVVTSCDPGGCWDSYGTRLNRAGPNLIGPQGLCTVHGALLNCP
jgi:hypothetical protein